MKILKRKQVVFEEQHIYLAGASTVPEDCLVDGVHYATSLKHLRDMIRAADSWVAPETNPVCSRKGNAGGVAEKLMIQRWAACGPDSLPTFITQEHHNSTKNEDA